MLRQPVRHRRYALGLLASILVMLAGVGNAAGEHEVENADARVQANCTATGDFPDVVTVETFPFQTADGSTLVACLVYPTDGAVTTLVTFAHGSGHVVQESWVHHMEETASKGVATVSTNYRDNFHFPTLWGAQDTIIVTQLALQRFPLVDNRILFGVSMGGAISGTAFVEAPEANGGALWDWWFAIEPVTDVAESWAEATAVGHSAGPGIERDAGNGTRVTPAEDPAAYERRSPVARAPEMAALGMKGSFVHHAVADGTVAYWQGRSMAAALCGAGVPTEMTTITRELGQGQRDDTTAFDLIGVGEVNEVNENFDLAGHASEADPTHPVMRGSLDRLFALIAGDEPAMCAEFVQDAATGRIGVLSTLSQSDAPENQPGFAPDTSPDASTADNAPSPNPTTGAAASTLPATGSTARTTLLLLSVLGSGMLSLVVRRAKI